MKVKTLIKYLKKIDPELEVFMSGDFEGNAYHGVDTVEIEKGGCSVIIYPDDQYLELEGPEIPEDLRAELEAELSESG